MSEPPQAPGPAPSDRAARSRRLRRYLAVVGGCAVALLCLPTPRHGWGPAPVMTAVMVALSTGMLVFSLLALRLTLRGPGG